MSRYHCQITYDGEDATLAYGFDHVAGYFYSIETDEDLEAEAGDSMRGLSRSRFLEKLEALAGDAVPEDHRTAIVLDLPF
jgi:hypothetical protein